MIKDNKTVVVSNKVVLYRPNLFTTVSYNNSEPRYETGIIIYKDDTETLCNVNTAMHNAIEQANFVDRENIKLPLRDGDIERANDPLFANSYFMFSSSPVMPEVYDHKLKQLFGKTNIGTGTYAKVHIDFITYNVKGNKGVSCRLYGVQILPLKSRILELQPDSKSVFQIEKG